MCADALHRYSFARDVAAGLWHLHAEQFVHRDLAARNLLLTGTLGDPSAMSVKIADFGMSRVVRDPLHLSADEDKRVALKWTAPEVLRDVNAYSPASDMFSFGVVLFEIWTTRQPYEGLDHIEAAQRVVTHGLRPSLESPALAPHALYAQVMRRCLGADVAPGSRMAAHEAHAALESLLALPRGSGAGGSSPSV